MKRIAIIGSGISGLYAAYLLNKQYDITIYEKENSLPVKEIIYVTEISKSIPITII